jgi:hypothetical protein
MTKVWIPVAFLMRLSIKMTLEKKISFFFQHGPPCSDDVTASSGHFEVLKKPSKIGIYLVITTKI